MATVHTARGQIDTAELGMTLMHEHVFTRSPGVFEAWPHLWDRAAEIANAVRTFRDLKAAGIDTIVDLTTVDLGRDVRMVSEVARQVDLNIIMATGVWRYPPRYFTPRNIDQVASLFVKDIEEGMEATDIRAAIIKVATEPDVDTLNEAMLRAVSRAHRRTGAPISTHTYVQTKCGLKQQDIFESEGVDLSRVVIGHSGDSDDIEYLTAIMKRGSYIGMDRFGLDMFLPTEKRIETVAKLCEMGYAGQMVLSHDTNCFMDTIPRSVRPERMPNWHYQHITRDILPALHERGVTEDQVRTMLVENPRRIFEKQGAY
ncbi:MAG TPA: phosphotriesterase-related protein [Dehalococcoidia bacterium]|nr:phosphotriesterase-related protein [Dehalococcoidia bacterium]